MNPEPLTLNTLNAHADLVGFLNAVGNVHADRVNPAYKQNGRESRYASLAEILDTVKPVAEKFNLAVHQSLSSSELQVRVTTVFIHRSGVIIDAGNLAIKSEGLSPQALASAVTYIKRILYQTACGISVDLDDDGNSTGPTPSYTPTRSATPFSANDVPGKRPLTK